MTLRPNNKPFRAVVVHDNPAMRHCLTGWLRNSGIAAVVASERQPFIDSLSSYPDLMIGSGVLALTWLDDFLAVHPGQPVIFHVDAGDVEMAVAAMKRGATEVITGQLSADRIIQAAHDVIRRRGDARHSPSDIGRLQPLEPLTPREREVLGLVVNGQTSKQAALELGISPRTVEVHRARVMEKLGARNTVALMRIVLKGA